jgi:hypothetical protein
MPTQLGGQLPPFDPSEKKPNSTVGPIEGDIKVNPTWRPDEIPRDARLAVVHPDHYNGEHGHAHDGSPGSHDGSHPRIDEMTAGSLSSDALAGDPGGTRAIWPDKFARSGGTRRK